MDESYFNLSIAKELESRLRARGFLVVMTRSTDQEVNADDFDANNDGQSGAGDSGVRKPSTRPRLTKCNRVSIVAADLVDVLVSLHVDGSSDPAVRGSRVWYAAGRPFGQLNQSLAALVYEELEHQMRDVGYPWIGQGIVETGDSVTAGSHAQLQQLLIGPDREGLKEPSAMPGVVVEVLTLTSDADAAFLASEQGISTIATALDQAIVRFVDASLRGAG
ncbi:MAG: N-acetylmuramoyl-L-alanine amidase [Thermomicrobiales bacterium]